MINNDDRELDRLADVHLTSGVHSSWPAGACLLEAVAYVAGEPHSDHPECTSTVLGAFGRRLNDVLPDDLRQQLKVLVPLLIGTRDDGHDEARSLLALDWLIRTWLPAWLQLADLEADARALRELAQIVDIETAQAACPLVREAREKAGEKRAAVSPAVWDAAGAAAGDAAGAAVRAAAWAAVSPAVWDAAWAAVWAAVWDAAGDAAGAAVGAAAGAAVGDHLQPTVTELQRSAIDLFTRMITAGAADEDAPVTAAVPAALAR